MNRRRFVNIAGVSAAIAAAPHAARLQSSHATSRKKVATGNAPAAAGPYSQAIIAGNTIYVAGQVPVDPKTRTLVEGDFEAQAVRAFENVKAIVEAAGATLADVVRVGVFLTDLSNFAKMNEVYRRYFSEDYPARTTVGVQLGSGYMIEVDCIAVK